MQHPISTEFKQLKVGDIVAEDYRRAAVFQRFGIDFCCGGRQTVESACEAAGVSYEEVERALLTAERRPGEEEGADDPRAWPLDTLIRHIVDVHHAYVRDALPMLQLFSHKVARVHGAHRPELMEVRGRVDALAEDLKQHVDTEEQVVFPSIRDLAADVQRAEAKGSFPPGQGSKAGSSSAIHPELRQAMEEDHDHAGSLMRELRDLTDGYAPPEKACTTYRALYAKLAEFEEDLHRHVHLENNVLFPRAEEMVATESAGSTVRFAGP